MELIGMPWVAPTLGIVDGRGNLLCHSCADELEVAGSQVAGDQAFGGDDKCSRCGWQFEHVPTSGYIRCE